LAGNRKEASRAMARHIHSGVKYWSRAMPDRHVPKQEFGNEVVRRDTEAQRKQERNGRS
jgi:hypothetical protein